MRNTKRVPAELSRAGHSDHARKPPTSDEGAVDGHLAATWKYGPRLITAIGLRDVDEAAGLVSATDKTAIPQRRKSR